ncbi:MAG TPA: hypothetical protein PKJ45_05890 [Rubrivivax sp.]|nr:hypothetical protein [Burkholderiales bacterium]HNU10877.1 hypothetical protein [Rubrivivax sp.]
MNKRPIETARDADLRLSRQALLRAAQRAREIAARTGTTVVIARSGVLEHIHPAPTLDSPRMHERPAGYGDKA